MIMMKVLGTLNIIFNKEEDGSSYYSGQCVELPAAVSLGNKSIPELTYNITQAILLVIQEMIKSGREEELRI
jgi:predicted RNase H-like HicB family nuclease